MKPRLSCHISILLWLDITIASSIPTPKAKCGLNTFYDEVTFKWQPCSLCFVMPEGTMFHKQCEACSCTATTSRMPTVVTNSTGRVFTTSATMMSTSYNAQPTLDTSNNPKLMEIIIPVAVVVAGILGLAAIIYCSCRKNRSSTTKGHVQGCFSKHSVKTPVPCSEEPSSGYQECQVNVITDYVTGRSSMHSIV